MFDDNDDEVVIDSHSYIVDDTWNDNMIKDIFYSSIEKHKNRDNVGISTTTTDDRVGEPGPWIQVPVQPSTHIHTQQQQQQQSNNNTNVAKKRKKVTYDDYDDDAKPRASPAVDTDSNTSYASYSGDMNISIDAIRQLEQEALNQMLSAWYHSGYVTGQYHAIRQLSETYCRAATNDINSNTCSNGDNDNSNDNSSSNCSNSSSSNLDSYGNTYGNSDMSYTQEDIIDSTTHITTTTTTTVVTDNDNGVEDGEVSDDDERI